MRSPIGFVPLILTLLVVAGCTHAANPPASSTVPSAQNVDTTRAWQMYNGTYAGDRWQGLDQIKPDNAKHLKVACRFATGETGAFQSGPVIVDDVIYFTTVNTTYAIDARTCALKWKAVYKPHAKLVFNTNRGVAYDNGTLYRGTQDCHMLAIAASSGDTLWDAQTCDSRKGEFLSSAPLVWQGMIFIGTAGADWGVRGRMLALSASDGHQLWSFDLIPVGNEPGANTWGNASSAATGGGSTWTSYALDPQSGELFVPVGNPAPDFSGDYRPGANLYTCSLVVLDAKSGALKWYYQLVPHDVHDYDLGAPPALITTASGKRLVVVAGKNGYLYALDRDTHALVYKTAVDTIQNSNAPPSIHGAHVCPGWVGGAEWNGPAYAHDANAVLVGTNEWCGRYVLGEARYVSGQFFLGGSFVADPYQTSHGWIYAVDANSGKVLWRDRTAGPALAAVSPTAGGVTFTGDLSGEFYAIDSKTGAIVYRYKTSGAMAGGVVAYQSGGKEYVAADSGNVSRSVWPGASGAATVYVFTL